MDKAQKHWERIQQKKKREAEQISAAIVKRDAWIMDAAECLVRQFRSCLLYTSPSPRDS